MSLPSSEIRRRLTGDAGQPLQPLSWWSRVDASLSNPDTIITTLWASRQCGKTTRLVLDMIESLLLVPNSFGLFVSASREQAVSILHRKLRLPLLRFLRAAGLPENSLRFTADGVENQSLDSAVVLVAASETTTPSRSLSKLYIDEARYIEDGVFTALMPSLIAANGKALIASTAGPPSGFFHDLCTHPDPAVRVIRLDGNENPSADQKIIAALSGIFRRIAPTAAARDLDNQFVEDGDEFLPAPLIEACVDDRLGELTSSPHPAFCFYDLSRKRDLTSRVVVIVCPAERPEAKDHLRVASIRIWDPRKIPTGEVPFAEVRADLGALPQRFPSLRKILVDEGAEAGSLLPFARQHTALVLKTDGFVATGDSNMKLWAALAARLHAGTLSLPRHERLLAELKSLRQESFSLGSRWRIVDASRKLHRDVSLSLAGACFAASESPVMSAHAGPSMVGEFETGAQPKGWESTPEHLINDGFGNRGSLGQSWYMQGWTPWPRG